MASTPRANIADDTIQGLHCVICGEPTLQIVHVERLPDYVECSTCKSAYIMEDGGDRVLYGHIAEGYPQTSQFALKQWAWLEAIETRSREERQVPEAEIPLTPDSLQEEPQSTVLEQPTDIEAEEPDTVPSEWSVLNDASLTDEPGDLSPEEYDPGYEAEAVPQVPASLISDERSEEQQDEQEQATGWVEQELGTLDEAEDLPAYEAEYDAAHQEQVEESDEIPGFAWLGGLADEDSALEEPDLPIAEEAPPIEEVPAEPSAAEAGLSAEDLDDLFMSDSTAEQEVSTFYTSDEEFPAEQEGMLADSDWSTMEPDLPAMEADEPAESPDSWLDEIDAVQDESEELRPISDHEPLSEGPIETEDELDWQAVEPRIDDEPELEVPYDEWLQDAPGEESIEPDDVISDFESAGTGYSLDAEESDEDFLSSLRDSAAIPLESQPLEDHAIQEQEDPGEPSPPSWAIDEDQEDFAAMAARMQAVTASQEAAVAKEGLLEEPSEPLSEDVEQEASKDDEIHYRESDPPPGHRHRVVVGGERVVFPGGECVHCGRTPVKGQLAIAGTLPEGQGMGDRKPTRFQVPLCGECRDRATSLSEDAKSARLQSLLFALIVGMAFLVGALAFGLVNPGEMRITDWFILLILFIIGFAGSAILLLSRINNYPPPLDAAYVRTTLLIPSETQGLETAFEWRNAEYAQRFYEANQSNALGNVTQVKDRLILSRSK